MTTPPPFQPPPGLEIPPEALHQAAPGLNGSATVSVADRAPACVRRSADVRPSPTSWSATGRPVPSATTGRPRRRRGWTPST